MDDQAKPNANVVLGEIAYDIDRIANALENIFGLLEDLTFELGDANTTARALRVSEIGD